MESVPQDKESIFNAALAYDNLADRAAFVDSACGLDNDLKMRIDALLKAHDAARGFLDDPIIDPEATVDASQFKEKPGTVIGRYKLLELIGEGGFGAVYMAEQEAPIRRKVALKIIKLGMDTKHVIARFEAERQALALMDHPNIARVLDAGATDTGRPYFVMELVKGIPITHYCDQNHLSTRQRLELFNLVCLAVQHAHQKGIIHRDIKPTNVLVTLHDGVAVPKVIDFGIAKATSQRLTEKTLFTGFREFIGTPEYMSPDQAGFSGLDVDTRSDIYSLGVLLYELLTSTPPIDPKTLREASYGEMQRILRDEDPPMPSARLRALSDQGTPVSGVGKAEPVALSRLLRGDLDWIVMKALEKDRTRRYQTAHDLAVDVARHLRHEPVQAGPPRLGYKLAKFLRRNRTTAALAAVVLVACLIGLVRETMNYYQVRIERDAARESEARAVSALTQADAEATRSKRIADFLQSLLISADPDEAIGLDVDVDKVAATAREVFGDDHATVAATLSSLAIQLQGTGDLDGAEPLLRESLRIWQNLYGEWNINVAVARSRLGRLLRIRGDTAEAERELRQSLAVFDMLPDSRSVAVALPLLELADVLQNRGAYDEAEESIRESIRIREQYAPHQRFQIAISYNLLIRELLVAGKRSEIPPEIRKAMEVWQEALPQGSKSLASMATQFAGIMLQQQELDDAESLFMEALEVYRKSPDPPLVFVKSAIGGMVEIHNRRDDKSQAFVPVRMELVKIAREICSRYEPYLGEVLIDHAAYLRDRGRAVEAIRMGIEGLTILQSTDPENNDISRALVGLQHIAWKMAVDPMLTSEEYEAGVEAIETCLSADKTNFAAINTLGILQYRLAEYTGALETLARSDAHYSKINEGGMPHDVAFIAMAHHQLGHKAEAGAAMIRLRELMTKTELAEDKDNRGFLKEAESLTGEHPPQARVTE
jgi:tetratricopeptide (TPR) repeat protein